MPIRARGVFVALILAAVTSAMLMLAAGYSRAADISCEPITAVQAQLAPILAPRHGEVMILMGPDAVAYLGVVNAEPPETQFAGDGVLLAVVPGAGVTVGIIHGAQACVAGRIGPDIHARAMIAVSAHRA